MRDELLREPGQADMQMNEHGVPLEPRFSQETKNHSITSQLGQSQAANSAR